MAALTVVDRRTSLSLYVSAAAAAATTTVLLLLLLLLRAPWPLLRSTPSFNI